MTITNANKQTLSFTGDGATKTFPINTLSGELISGVAFFFASELKVYVNEILQTLNTHYTITSSTPPINLPNRIVNANVVFTTAPALNAKIVAVYRGTPAQISSFQTGQGPEPETLEYILDKLAVDLQKTNYNIARSLRLADSNDFLASLPPLPDPEEGKILAWGTAGQIVNQTLAENIPDFPTPELNKVLTWNNVGGLANTTIADAFPVDITQSGSGVTIESDFQELALKSKATFPVKVQSGADTLATFATASTTFKTDSISIDNGAVTVKSGSVDPEGSQTANVGSLFLRKNGNIGTTLYVKETGTGNTGWRAFGVSGSGSVLGFDYNPSLANLFFGTDVPTGLITTGTTPQGSNEPGRRNTVGGLGAGEKMTTGHWNAYFGDTCFANNRTGKANVGVGKGAGESNANSDDSVMIGESAGGGHVTGNSCTFVGTNTQFYGIPTALDHTLETGTFGQWEVDAATGLPITGESNVPNFVGLVAVAAGVYRRAVPNGETYTAVFKRIAAGTTRATFDVTEQALWTLIEREIAVPLWQPSTAYVVGDYRKAITPGTTKRALYQANVNHTSGATFNSTEDNQWTLIAQVDPVLTVGSVTAVGSGAIIRGVGSNNCAFGVEALAGNAANSKVISATSTSIKLSLLSSPTPNAYVTDLSSPLPRRIALSRGAVTTKYGVSADHSPWVANTVYAGGEYFTQTYGEVYSGSFKFRSKTGLYKVPPGGLTSGATFNVAEAIRYQVIGLFSSFDNQEFFIYPVDMLSYDQTNQTIATPTMDVTPDANTEYIITFFDYDSRLRNKDSNYQSNNNSAFGIQSLISVENVSDSASFGRRGMYYLKDGIYCDSIGANAGETFVDNSRMTNASNITLVGNRSKVSGSNQLQLGNTTQTVYSQSAITIRSDKRDKYNPVPIQDDTRYTDLIDVLPMYTFQWDRREFYNYFDYEKDEQVIINNGVPDGSQRRKRRHTGTLAQDIPTSLEMVGLSTDEFAAYIDSSYDGEGIDVKSVQYEQFIPILWEATRQLRKENHDLKKRLDSIEERLNANS